MDGWDHLYLKNHPNLWNISALVTCVCVYIYIYIYFIYSQYDHIKNLVNFSQNISKFVEFTLFTKKITYISQFFGLEKWKNLLKEKHHLKLQHTILLSLPFLHLLAKNILFIYLFIFHIPKIWTHSKTWSYTPIINDLITMHNKQQ
jgi:hypothetical protein